MFSKTCKYGIRAVIFIASESLHNRRVGIKDIAERIDSPQAFTAKILQTLVRNEIIRSVKGVGGGFEIPAENLAKIKLSQIVTAIDGEDIFTKCGLGLTHCSDEHPCPIHNKFKFIKVKLTVMLEGTTLEELALGIKTEDTFLRY
ncbi:rrf2 family protein, putative transcriptional regulator [Flavobacterium enshiense DK69]|uniref:Rrf2 family transcriptional regulator n=1 Tax=Flavobacterium enshiense DK69 TaxID=1107311 RepID=V6SAA7_9FLAO|nr:Rrf2 family transcriptional regulator [Flavobacterium enshiense]ESU23384.1 rrf2 family protein, putative transcriptional regulator [Flavobacterium enshiense DK69]KGO96388.1 Rrf2 family transcriptional regulator [Flavobacterium enshiense DK69]